MSARRGGPCKRFEAHGVAEIPLSPGFRRAGGAPTSLPACGGAVQKKTETPKEPDFFKVYDEFMFECGEKNVWTEATFEKMRAMLDKYKDVPSKDGLAFPYHTNQAMNRDIKVLCRIAGIDQEERITTYRGNERIDEIKKKYELADTIKASEMSKMNFMD